MRASRLEPQQSDSGGASIRESLIHQAFVHIDEHCDALLVKGLAETFDSCSIA